MYTVSSIDTYDISFSLTSIFISHNKKVGQLFVTISFAINIIFFDLNQLVKKVLSLIFVDVSIFLTPCKKTRNSLSFFVKTAFSLKHQYRKRFCLHKGIN